MPNINFLSDFEKDLEYIQKYFHRFRKISGNYFDILLKSSYPKCYKKSDKEILEYFKKNRKTIIKRNKIAGKKLKQKWNKINYDFFKQVSQITNFKWKNKIYYCHISSSYLCGGYNEPIMIVVCPILKESTATLAHELVHLHLLDILNQLNISIEQKEYWRISEIIVTFLISKLSINQVKHKREIGYSELIPIYKKLKFSKEKSFEKLILNCLEISKL